MRQEIKMMTRLVLTLMEGMFIEGCAGFENKAPTVLSFAYNNKGGTDQVQALMHSGPTTTYE
jgi:hypothetical protein